MTTSIFDTNIEQFFSDARTRQRIYHKKMTGEPKPWTEDHAMQSIYLTNVFREQDKTTKWFRENVRNPYSNDPVKVFAATVLFRWFNRIETGEAFFLYNNTDETLFDIWYHNLTRNHSPEILGSWLAERLEQEAERPYFTGAYMIKLENGVDKHLSVAQAAGKVTQAYMARKELHLEDYTTLEGWTNWLRTFNGLGGFMAYEIVSDLRWTCLGENCTDINTWANIGPGCARGLSRLYNDNHHGSAAFMQNPHRSLEIMGWILEQSRKPEYWPASEPKWEMREVEHWSCEWDKIQRARSGIGRIKRKYQGV